MGTALPFLVFPLKAVHTTPGEEFISLRVHIPDPLSQPTETPRAGLGLSEILLVAWSLYGSLQCTYQNFLGLSSAII